MDESVSQIKTCNYWTDEEMFLFNAPLMERYRFTELFFRPITVRITEI